MDDDLTTFTTPRAESATDDVAAAAAAPAAAEVDAAALGVVSSTYETASPRAPVVVLKPKLRATLITLGPSAAAEGQHTRERKSEGGEHWQTGASSPFAPAGVAGLTIRCAIASNHGRDRSQSQLVAWCLECARDPSLQLARAIGATQIHDTIGDRVASHRRCCQLPTRSQLALRPGARRRLDDERAGIGHRGGPGTKERHIHGQLPRVTSTETLQQQPQQQRRLLLRTFLPVGSLA